MRSDNTLTAKRSHFIKGYVSFDVQGTIEKREATIKYIKRQRAKDIWGTTIMIISLLTCVAVMAIGFIYGISICFDSGWPPNFAGMFPPIIKSLLIAAVFAIIAIIAHLIATTADIRESRWDYYDNAEIFLETEYLDMITSFVVYDEKKADLYMQYRVYDGTQETTDVFIIKGFRTRRTTQVNEPVLDVDNNIYYVPQGYVN